GMGGMGGMGGMFNVDDSVSFSAYAVDDTLSLGSKAPAGVNDTAPSLDSNELRPITLEAEPNLTETQQWDRYFTQLNESPAYRQQSDEPGVTVQREKHNARVRETVRQLMNDKKFTAVQAIIMSALRHGHPQPWMYEALGLAMQAGGAPAEDLERALMSTADFSQTLDEMYYLARYLSRVGLDGRALQMYREISQANPTRPEPYVEALAVAQRVQDLETIQWACVGILKQAWPSDEAVVEARARRAAVLAMKTLQESGRESEAREFRDALNRALVRDCVAKVEWTGNADIDIMIEEPSGTVCSLRNQRTVAGGVILGDTSSIVGRPNGSNSFNETYVCPEAFAGRYRLVIRKIWGDVTAGKVTVEITKNVGTSQPKTIRQQIPIGSDDAMVVFDLDEGRRVEPLDEQQVANAVHKHIEVGRAVLAQQVSDTASSDAALDLALARRGFGLGNANLRNLLGRSAVGFQPVITTLPEGTTLSATAVVSSDRRYVRINATPFFSAIRDVFTFNFVTGDQTQVENNGVGNLGNSGNNGNNADNGDNGDAAQ
ncbi:MAG: hypothetical protein KDA99_05800, partial [Planctomycetales bacterium]|nr:hypothetical protein [Planctomycetales bacterium]